LVFDSRQLAVISLLDWKESFLKEDYAPKYRKQILAKLPVIFKKHTYKIEKFISVVSAVSVRVNKNDRCIKLVRLILNYCEKKGFLNIFIIIFNIVR
jgi:hypothetical protein